MKLPTVPTSSVVDHLNATYFHQIWNAPDESRRSNIRLVKAAEKMQTGAVPVGESVVGLPTTDSVYAVYKTGYQGLHRFVDFPSDIWVKAGESLGPLGISLAAYASSGRCVPGSEVYLRYIPTRNQVLIAVSVTYTKACIGQSYPNLYLTMYRDTTRATPIQSTLYRVGNPLVGGTLVTTIAAAVLVAKTNCPLGTTVLVNGWVYDPDHVPSLVTGDIVQVVSDPDVVGMVEVDVDDNQTGYYSTHYGEYRELLHIPRAINPQNILITTDSLTTVVFDPATHKGVLGHRVDENAVESVTHNDFSMGRTAIQGFSNSLNAATVKVRLYVRFPASKNYLTEDVNHLSDLYAMADSEIIKQLLGLSSQQIVEWKASVLETSGFLALLYRFDGFDQSVAIPSYVDAMGYYDVASTLGQQMRFYTYQGAQVLITKPARLFGYNCQALVYANGEKVPEGQYNIANETSRAFSLGFGGSSGVKIGDRIAVYIAEEGYRTPIPFSPTAQIPTITLDSEDYTLFKVVAYTDPKPVWNGSVTKGYKRVPLGTADYTVTNRSDGQVDFELRMKHYGSSFYFIPNYGLTTAAYDLTTMVTNNNPILIDLTGRATNLEIIPLLNYATMEVYLNRRRLIEGIDYECQVTEGEDGYILQNLLAVSNQAYLDLEGGPNLLEVGIHGDIIASEDKGYAVENLLHRTGAPMIWTRPSSRVFVDGILQEHISESGNIAVTTADVPNGAPFLMQYMVAFGAGKLLKALSPNHDINLRSRIEKVLGIIPPDYPDLVLLDQLHALYSPFLAKIVTDVGTGAFVIADEPRNDRFLRQFQPYAPLLERDPTLQKNNPLIDRRFVTLAAHYANYAVDDPEQMMRVQRLVTLTLTPAELSIEDVLL